MPGRAIQVGSAIWQCRHKAFKVKEKGFLRKAVQRLRPLKYVQAAGSSGNQDRRQHAAGPASGPEGTRHRWAACDLMGKVERSRLAGKTILEVRFLADWKSPERLHRQRGGLFRARL